MCFSLGNTAFTCSSAAWRVNVGIQTHASYLSDKHLCCPQCSSVAHSAVLWLSHLSLKLSFGFSSPFLRLSRGWGFCLDDRPSKRDIATPLARLGIRYTTHHQCQLQYGPNATFCPEVDVCVMTKSKTKPRPFSLFLTDVSVSECVPDSLVFCKWLLSLQTGFSHRWYPLWTREGEQMLCHIGH